MENLNRADLGKIYDEINDEWFEGLHRLNEQAFRRAAKKGRVDVIVNIWEPKVGAVNVVYDEVGHSRFLTCVVPKEIVQLGEIKRDDDIWEVMVEDKEITTDVVAKELPSYIHMYYPKGSGLPINLYGSMKDFQSKVPLRRVSIEKGLIVVKRT